jgi:hypothetical protein
MTSSLFQIINFIGLTASQEEKVEEVSSQSYLRVTRKTRERSAEEYRRSAYEDLLCELNALFGV